jgi:hypothetical protein
MGAVGERAGRYPRVSVWRCSRSVFGYHRRKQRDWLGHAGLLVHQADLVGIPLHLDVIL